MKKIIVVLAAVLIGSVYAGTFKVTAPQGASIKSTSDWKNKSDYVGEIKKGETFNTTAVFGDWQKVKVTAGKTNVGLVGYVWAEAIANGKIGTAQAKQGACILDRPGTDVNGKKTAYKTLGYLFPETSVDILETEITWVQLERKPDSQWKQAWTWIANGEYKK